MLLVLVKDDTLLYLGYQTAVFVSACIQAWVLISAQGVAEGAVVDRRLDIGPIWKQPCDNLCKPCDNLFIELTYLLTNQLLYLP